jgi:hypothetical protein
MKEVIAVHAESLSMDLKRDSKYAPVTNAEKARAEKEREEAIEEEKKQKEEAKRKRMEAAKNSQVSRSLAYVPRHLDDVGCQFLLTIVTHRMPFALMANSGFSRGSAVKKVPHSPHLYLVCHGHYLVDTSCWPPKFEASDLCAVRPQLVRPGLYIAQQRTTRRVRPQSFNNQESLFLTDSLPFKLSKVQPADDLVAELNAAIGPTAYQRLDNSSKIAFRGLVRHEHRDAYPTSFLSFLLSEGWRSYADW